MEGFALRGSSDDGYCDDSEWLELFNGCLDCALEFDIWRHYGGGLTPAAEACGLDATPKPVDGEETTTSPAEVVSETSAVDTTTVEVTATEESTVATATATETEDASETWTSSAAEHTESHSESAAVTTTATWTSTYVSTGTGGLNTVCTPARNRVKIKKLME